ncbi:RNA-binding protein [Rhodobacteraceae bacterium NNCM2]|nr:RNA-binding protein [Coraliihabitans acroporae]
MTRGGRHKQEDGPERRCIASGECGDPADMIRFVLGPDGSVVPDVAGKLPGRGAWLTASRPLVEKAVKKRLFSRGFKKQVQVPEGLPELLERLIAERLGSTIALARKAGQAVTGYEKTRAHLIAGKCAVLVQASDGADEGRNRLSRLADALPQIDLLTARELGLAFGRDFAIHAALEAGGLADRAMIEARRLSGLRSGLEEKAAVDPASFGNFDDNGPADGLAQDIG